MTKKFIVILATITFCTKCYCQDYNKYIKGKTWYAIKIIVGDSGPLDREFSPYDQTSYLLYFKINSVGGLSVHDTRTNNSKFRGKSTESVKISNRNFTIQYTADLTEELEILYCDEHFLELRDNQNVVYFFISDSYKWEKKGRIN